MNGLSSRFTTKAAPTALLLPNRSSGSFWCSVKSLVHGGGGFGGSFLTYSAASKSGTSISMGGLEFSRLITLDASHPTLGFARYMDNFSFLFFVLLISDPSLPHTALPANAR